MDDVPQHACKLVSDNKFYQSYEIDKEDIMEIWEAVMFISQNFPEQEQNTGSDINNLKNIVLELQQDIIKLKERLPE